jgi:hypothetical protein
MVWGYEPSWKMWVMIFPQAALKERVEIPKPPALGQLRSFLKKAWAKLADMASAPGQTLSEVGLIYSVMMESSELATLYTTPKRLRHSPCCS